MLMPIEGDGNIKAINTEHIIHIADPCSEKGVYVYLTNRHNPVFIPNIDYGTFIDQVQSYQNMR